MVAQGGVLGRNSSSGHSWHGVEEGIKKWEEVKKGRNSSSGHSWHGKLWQCVFMLVSVKKSQFLIWPFLARLLVRSKTKVTLGDRGL